MRPGAENVVFYFGAALALAWCVLSMRADSANLSGSRALSQAKSSRAISESDMLLRRTDILCAYVTGWLDGQEGRHPSYAIR